jgi:hypothetical protein
MQEDLVQLRQAVAQSMAALKRQEQQYNQWMNPYLITKSNKNTKIIYVWVHAW